MATMPTAASVQAGKPDHHVAGERFLDLEKLPVVDDALDDFQHVIGRLGSFRDNLADVHVDAVRVVIRFDTGWFFEITLRQVGQQFPHHGQRFFVVGSLEVRHAAVGVVLGRPAERLLGHAFVGDRLDDLRAGDEHVAGFIHHEDEVGDGRRVTAPPAQGPMITEIWGTTPEASTFLRKISP